VQALAQAQAAGIKGDEAHALIQRGGAGEDLANLRRRENHRELELGLSAHQFHFGRPDAPQAFLPKDFDGTQRLSRGLAGDFLLALEVDEILAQLFRADQFRCAVEILGPLANTGEVRRLAARCNRQKLQVIGEGF